MRVSRGFTLIELLVVIAIIAILAAILFPVFMTAKARAQQSACMENMKQLGLAVSTYLGDWNDTYPMNRFQDPLMARGQRMDGTRFNWKTAIAPYVRSRSDVWRCPSNIYRTSFDETGSAVQGRVSVILQYPISYALCGDYFNSLGTDYSLNPRKLGEIAKLSKQIFILESRFNAPDLGSGMLDWKTFTFAHVPGHDGWSWMQVHHDAVSNFLFADCHVRAMKIADTLKHDSMWCPPPRNQVYYNDLAGRLAPECY